MAGRAASRLAKTARPEAIRLLHSFCRLELSCQHEECRLPSASAVDLLFLITAHYLGLHLLPDVGYGPPFSSPTRRGPVRS
jgi:hypothetical protein